MKPYYRVGTNRGFYRGSYKPGELDFFAVYIEPLKLWYIIPWSEVGGRRAIYVYPNDPDSNGRYEKFKERWDLLRL